MDSVELFSWLRYMAQIVLDGDYANDWLYDLPGDLIAAAWFRGRALSCSCGKWLASGGGTLDSLPLYNQSALGQGQVIWVVENPVDAILVGLQTPYVGVATLSVSYWTDAWTERLRSAGPQMVVVCFDNDIPGNGGGWRHREMAREWGRKHNAPAPMPNGVKLVNRLLTAGIPARLFDWPAHMPVKADIGQLLMQTA